MISGRYSIIWLLFLASTILVKAELKLEKASIYKRGGDKSTLTSIRYLLAFVDSSQENLTINNFLGKNIGPHQTKINIDFSYTPLASLKLKKQALQIKSNFFSSNTQFPQIQHLPYSQKTYLQFAQIDFQNEADALLFFSSWKKKKFM